MGEIYAVFRKRNSSYFTIWGAIPITHFISFPGNRWSGGFRIFGQALIFRNFYNGPVWSRNLGNLYTVAHIKIGAVRPAACIMITVPETFEIIGYECYRSAILKSQDINFLMVFSDSPVINSPFT